MNKIAWEELHKAENFDGMEFNDEQEALLIYASNLMQEPLAVHILYGFKEMPEELRTSHVAEKLEEVYGGAKILKIINKLRGEDNE